MSIYKESDLELFADNINDIQKEVKRLTWDILEPRGDMKMEIVTKVIEYIKNKKRKIYGSYAHNKVIVAKNKNDNFLDELEVPDIDFYTPEPLKDLFGICNMFCKLGYNDINGKEAQHEETYKIFVNDIEACDISYVPTNIFNKIPYIEIEGINYVHPTWAMIDYFRILSDPLTSWEIKLDKRFKRLYLLQKHYPFKINNKPISINLNNKDDIVLAKNKIFRFVLDRPTIIVTSLYNYNYYLYESQIAKKNNGYKYTDIVYYELISIDYKKDGYDLIELMKQSFGNNFKYEEHYPFFQFTDFSARLYYKDILICVIYGNNKKCIPYHSVKAIYFEKDKAEETAETIKIASFSVMFLYSLVNHMYYRANNDDKQKEFYLQLISQIIQIRNYYLEKNKKNIFNSGIFKDFVVGCVGETITAKKEFSDRIKENIKNKKPALFSYRPSSCDKEAPNYIFSNSSGNKINNTKNYKLVKQAACNEELTIVKKEEAKEDSTEETVETPE